MTDTLKAWFGSFMAPAILLGVASGAATTGYVFGTASNATEIAVISERNEAFRAEMARTFEVYQRQADTTATAIRALTASVVPRAEYQATVERQSEDIAEIKRQIEQLGIELRAQRRGEN